MFVLELIMNMMRVHITCKQSFVQNVNAWLKVTSILQSFPSTVITVVVSQNRTRSEYDENKVNIRADVFCGEWNYTALSAADIIKKSHKSFLCSFNIKGGWF